MLPPHRSLIKHCHESSQNIQILGVTGMKGNKGIFDVWCSWELLERDLTLVLFSMKCILQSGKVHNYQWEQRSPVPNTLHSSVHRDMGQCPLSECKGSQILLSSGLRGLGVTSCLSAMLQ